MVKDYNDNLSLLEKYPYFVYAALKALPDAPDEETKAQLRRIIAVNIGDPADAAEILGLNSESLADFYPDTLPPKLDTVATIDTFLETFASEGNPTPLRIPLPPSVHDSAQRNAPGISDSSIPEAVTPDAVTAGTVIPDLGTTGSATPDDIIPNSATTDAVIPDVVDPNAVNPDAVNLGENQSPAPDPTASAIDAFLQSVPPPAPKIRRPAPLQKSEETPALTESFARILIKNHNYEKALQIIQELNLKNPEKSVYFADQIRFLKKLILNESRKQR